MNPGTSDFSHADRQAAENVAAATSAAGVGRIIYLGGLGEEGKGLSEHLASRAEVARILRNGRVPVTVLRAAMILGSGSASFEILRYLVDRLPVMVTPRWIDTPCQPIDVQNVLDYLMGCLECAATVGETFDIGQLEVVTYRQLMQIYAEEAGLRRRWIIKVPVLTPRVSSYWIHLVTPVSSAIARPLAEGLRNPVVCRDTRIRELIPQELLDCRLAIRLALERLRQQEVESSWTDAGLVPPAQWSIPGDPEWAGDRYSRTPSDVLMRRRQRSGGGDPDRWSHRLVYENCLGARGLLDRLAGGVGLGRGRQDNVKLRRGPLDFWRGDG
jgi:uncharacterized protein YbjT (DUF2867 family)